MYGCNINNDGSSNGKKLNLELTVTVHCRTTTTQDTNFNNVYEGKNVQIQKYNFNLKKGFSHFL